MGTLIDKVKLNEFNFDEVLKLFFLIVIISIFNRIAAYGTDITGQILALVLFSIFFELIKKENLNKFNRKNICIHFNVYLSDFDKNIFYDLLDITDYSFLSFRHQKN